MKFTFSKVIFTFSKALLTLSLFMGFDLSHAGEAKNVLENPGFEESTEVDPAHIHMYSAPISNEDFQNLLKQGVLRLSKGSPAILPNAVWINPDAGWKKTVPDATFEYVDGKPGETVHSGAHAIHIVSPATVGIWLGGDFFQVGVGSIQLDKEYRFSLYAKGNGEIIVTTYLYTSELAAILDDKARFVSPPSFNINNDNEWTKCEGTLKIKSSNVNSLRFVLNINGDVYIDDVALYVE